MITNITPIEVDNQHWVAIQIDGHELERRGPYRDIDEAEAAAARLAGICRVMHADVRLPAARRRA